MKNIRFALLVSSSLIIGLFTSLMITRRPEQAESTTFYVSALVSLVLVVAAVLAFNIHVLVEEYFPGKDTVTEPKCDSNGLRWHKLTAISEGGLETDVLAATCIDGIGVLVRWEYYEQWDGYCSLILNSETGEWNSPTAEDIQAGIPRTPPTMWDDK